MPIGKDKSIAGTTAIFPGGVAVFVDDSRLSAQHEIGMANDRDVCGFGRPSGNGSEAEADDDDPAGKNFGIHLIVQIVGEN